MSVNSDSDKLEIGYTAYSVFDVSSNNTGFRCVSNMDYPSDFISGCPEEEACNYDIFAEVNQNCQQNDCLGVCGGNAQLNEYYQDLDGDNLCNPEISEIQCDEPEEGWVNDNTDLDDNCNNDNFNIDCAGVCAGEAYIDGCGECVGGNTGNEPCGSTQVVEIDLHGGSNLISFYQYGPPPLSKQGPYCVLLVLESSNA